MTASDALVGALIALVGGLLVAVLAGFLQRQGDHERWLRDKRQALYSQVAETLDGLQNASTAVIRPVNVGRGSARREDIASAVAAVAEIEDRLRGPLLAQADLLASRKMRALIYTVAYDYDVQWWFESFDKHFVSTTDLPPMIGGEDVENFTQQARRDIGAETRRERLAEWSHLWLPRYRFRVSRWTARLRRQGAQGTGDKEPKR